MTSRPDLARVLDVLEKAHGKPKPPPTTDSWPAAPWKSCRGPLEPRCDRLIRAHLLLRRHGQTLCRRSRPRCEACPVASVCAYSQTATARH